MTDGLPQLDSVFVITLTYAAEEGVIVDTRGFNLLEAYTLLTMGAEAVRDRLEDAFLIADDEDADLVARVQGGGDDDDEDD